MFYTLQIHNAENLCSHRVTKCERKNEAGQQIPSLGHHSPTTLWLLHNRFRAVRPLRFADLESKRRVYAKQTAVSQTARDLSLTLDSCESRRGLHRVIQDTGSDYRTGINRVPIHISPNCKMWRIASAGVVRNFMFSLTSAVDDDRSFENGAVLIFLWKPTLNKMCPC